VTDANRWAVEYERRALRDLRQLDPPVRQRVVAAIDRLAAGEQTADVKRLQGQPLFRLRVGDWRVLFRQDGERLIITVVRALPRGRAYDR
jgi:mRNA interferase RelE/StbE